MERLFFVKQFLKPTLIAADKNIKDVRFNSGVNGEYLHIEFEDGRRQHKNITGLSLVETLAVAANGLISE